MRRAALRKASKACGPSFISAGTVFGFMGIRDTRKYVDRFYIGVKMRDVKGAASFHANGPQDVRQLAGGFNTFCGVQPRRTGHPPFVSTDSIVRRGCTFPLYASKIVTGIKYNLYQRSENE
jgi:hypothetical protein